MASEFWVRLDVSQKNKTKKSQPTAWKKSTSCPAPTPSLKATGKANHRDATAHALKQGQLGRCVYRVYPTSLVARATLSSFPFPVLVLIQSLFLPNPKGV
ncbi:hypothetical protein KIL84_015217 [Mauremys mutica]|uniref:Uncharacterized protein n=1 Tax=Mauremys mutica TaxID=74926 RepID=A0A9D3WSQ9_9SAUR|nr:hypothetical protein KIL84_015217 [Mauremys mutica]